MPSNNMPSYVLPRIFELDIAALDEITVFDAGRIDAASAPLLSAAINTWKVAFARPPLRAVALRWRVDASLGFPITTFSVWRRRRLSAKLNSLAVSSFNVSGPGEMTWNGIPLMDLAFTCTATGSGCSCFARNDLGEDIPGQVVVVQAGVSQVRFHCPNICSLRVTGTGTITNIQGLPLFDFAQPAPDWQKVVESPDVPLLNRGNTTAEQNAVDLLARRRLAFANLLWTPPSPVGGAALPLLNCGAFLADLNLDLVPDLRAMMQSVPQSSFKVPSANGDDITDSDIPLLPVTLMAAAMDNFLAVGLGLGSTEIEENPVLSVAAPSVTSAAPVTLMPAAAATLIYDYMVSADFAVSHVPQGKLTLCAIANPPSFKNEAPNGLTLSADPQRRQRPDTTNDIFNDDVLLHWKRGLIGAPYGYNVAVRRGTQATVFLNQTRAGSLAPFLPTNRTEAIADDLAFHSHHDRSCPVPLKIADSPVVSTYSISHVDCFGRSTPWTPGTYSSAVVPPQVPALISVSLSKTINALDVEWNWNLTDRTWGPLLGPDAQATGAIEFRVATFKPSDPAPPLPSTLPVAASVIHVQRDSSGGLVRYLTTISNFPISFTAAENGWLDLAVFARATSWVDPNNWSAFSSPVIVHLADPTPPPKPAVIPSINWTAAPDARNVARAVLDFQPVPGATGYSLYRASEASVRLGAANPGAVDTIVTGLASQALFEARMAALETILNDPGANSGTPPVTYRSLNRDLFLRVNSTLSASPRLEVELSGDSSDIWAYFVRAVSATNVESDPSLVTYAAVPKELKPRPPHLTVREKDPKQLQATILVHALADTATTSISLFLARRRELLAEAGLLGPAFDVVESHVAAVDPLGELEWDFASDSRVLDRSWRPYYFCAMARSAPASDSGLRGSQSGLSNMIELYILPKGPPDLVAGGVMATLPSGHRLLMRVQVRSAAEVILSPLGPHRLEFFQVDSSAGSRVLLASTLLHEMAEPKIRRTATVAGQSVYEILVVPSVRFILARLTDPGGGVTEVLQSPPVILESGSSTETGPSKGGTVLL